MVLEILVSGLCAFVRESCALGNAKAMHVVMLKGPQKHLPQLVIDARNVVPPAANDSKELQNGRQLAAVLDLPNGHQYFVWDLTGYKLEIVGAPAIGIVEGGRDYSNPQPNEDPHGKTDQPDDFSWIPELHKACGATVDKAKAKPAFLDDKKLPSAANARMMKLTVDPTASAKNSWLEAHFHGETAGQPVYVFGKTTYKQALADGARLTMQLSSFPIKLRLVPYKGKLTKEIQLTAPVLGEGSDRISISLSNMPKNREVNDPEIKHFKAYRDVLDKNPGSCELPKAEGMAMGHHVEPVKCTVCSSCGTEE